MVLEAAAAAAAASNSMVVTVAVAVAAVIAVAVVVEVVVWKWKGKWRRKWGRKCKCNRQRCRYSLLQIHELTSFLICWLSDTSSPTNMYLSTHARYHMPLPVVAPSVPQ